MKKWLWIGLPLVALLGLVGWRFSTKAKAGADLAAQQGQRKNAPATAELIVAGPKDLVSQIEAAGSVESPFRVEISPKSSGRIEELNVREGDPVTKGSVLVVIDPSDLKAAVYQQEANLAAARSRLAEAKFGQGPNDARVKGSISQKVAGLESTKADFNQATRNYDAQVASADAAVTDAESRLNSARVAVDNAKAAIAREQASLVNANGKYDRAKALFDQGFASAQALDDALAAREVQRRTVDVAMGQLATAEAAVKSANAQLGAARNQASIVRRKGQADIVAAKSKVTQAQVDVDVARSDTSQTPAYRENLAALQSAVMAAQAQLAQARAKLSDTTLRSPIDGTVTARSADPGALATPGQPILVVQWLKWLFVTAALPIENSPDVHVGQTVAITFDALPGETFTGQLSNINPAADTQSRQFGVRVRIENKDGKIKPGMFGKLLIPTHTVKAKIVVPREAIKTDKSGKRTVVVVDDKNVARTQEVTVGASDGTLTEILSGLSPGEKVVKLAYGTIRDGQTVTSGQGKDQGQGKGQRQR